MNGNPISRPLPSTPPSPAPVLRRSHAVRGVNRLSAEIRQRRASRSSIASVASVATMASVDSAYSAPSASSAYSDDGQSEAEPRSKSKEDKDKNDGERAQQAYEAAYGRLGTLQHPAVSNTSPSDHGKRVSYHGLGTKYPIPESMHQHTQSHPGVHGRIPSSSSMRSVQSVPDGQSQGAREYGVGEPERRAYDPPFRPYTPERNVGSSNVAGGDRVSPYRGASSPTPRYPGQSPPYPRNQYDGAERQRQAYASSYGVLGLSRTSVSDMNTSAASAGKRTSYYGLESRSPARYPGQRPRNYTPMPIPHSRISSSSSTRSAGPDWVVPFRLPFARWPPEVYSCILKHLPLDTPTSREIATMLKVEVARSLYRRWVQAPAHARSWRKAQRGPKAWPTFTHSIDRDSLYVEPTDIEWKVDLGTDDFDLLDLEPVQLPCPPEYVTALDNAPRILFLCNLLLELRDLKPDSSKLPSAQSAAVTGPGSPPARARARAMTPTGISGGASAIPGSPKASCARVLDGNELVELFVASSILGDMAHVLTATNACFDSCDDVDSGPASIYRALQALSHIECLYADMMKSPVRTKSVLQTVYVPPFDLRGRVVWSEIKELQSKLFALARYPRQTLNGLARAVAPLGPRRPLSDVSLLHGDWAGITGQWVCTSTRGSPPTLMTWGIATLKVVAEHELPTMVHRGDHYDFGPGRSQIAQTSVNFNIDLLSSGLPSRHVPPLFFAGRSKRVTDKGVFSYHITGAVRLTTDDPPELRVQLVIRRGGRDSVHFDGVQVGGLGSTRGIIGVSSDPETPQTFKVGSPREVVPLGVYVSPPPKPPPPRQHVHPMWLWKLD